MGTIARRAAAAVAVAALLATPAGAADAPRRPIRSADLAVAPTADDAQLRRNLDAVVAASPDDSCLVVGAGSTELYAHRADDPQVPASLQKLLTAGAALDLIGPEARYVTRAVAAAAPVDGTLVGDLHLVGGGDPTLAFRAARRDRPATRLADLADAIAASGVRRITGRVVGDDARYDDLRVVPSWPARYVEGGDVGPLGALLVDGGYRIDEDGRRRRSEQPALDAAVALTALLAERGVEVVGEPGAGRAPAGEVLAELPSAPLHEIVADLVRLSDNQAAELVTKEIGQVVAGEGSTAAGARSIAGWLAEIPGAGGATVVDGSGLDLGNRATCAQVQAVLLADGPGGPISEGLAVAGTTGTLRGRLGTGAARGVLRGKTGTLNSVTALAGHVTLLEGAVATFTYIVNAPLVTPADRDLQAFLAEVLADLRPPCPDADRSDLGGADVADLSAAAAAAVGAGPVAATVAAASTAALAARGSSLVDRCSAEGRAAVVLGSDGA